YLARKFFHLWAKKTFGQVFPSKARCFYDQKILQKTFGEWKEWWTVCGERKLSLRAGSHYRHLLQNLIFKAWRAYVCQQQGKRNKYCVAESHAKKQKLLRTWRHWLVYVDVQRTKHGMQSVALAFRERSCLRISWAVWRRRHYQNSSGHKMNILALQHWAQSLQFRAWLQWRELYLYSQNDKQKETRAVTHHRHWELKRCMEAWLGYLNLHREKKLQNELAQEHHQRRIVRQCFSHWQLSWECRRRVHAHQKDIEKLAARIALWRVFAHWKHYVVLCVEETRQCELAEKHYKHHLLVLQKFWNHWKSRLEHEEEQQQQALTSVAHAHYRVLLQCSFVLFLNKKSRVGFSKYFQGRREWIGLLTFIKTISFLKEFSPVLTFSLFACRRVLMKQVFDTWLLNACNQQEYRMGEERAVLHFERQLLRCCWRFWHRRTAACLEEQEGLVRARDHYSNLLLLKAFGLWKQNTQERKTERLKEMQALRFQYSKCLQQTWNKWKEYMGHQREKWRKLVQADMHYRHTLLCKTLAAWKSYQHNVQCVLYQVAEKEKQHTRLLLRQLLCTWRENTLALICEVKATTQADEHYRRAILSKVLLQWRYTALLQVRCRQQKVTAVMEARKRLDIVRLQTLFLHWKELTRESLMLRAQQQRAVQHHQQHLLQKYLVKWKEYHQQRVGKMLLQRQGDWLMTRRLCSASFSCWKTQLLRQRWEKRKTVQALWHWSLSLQRKVFDAWLTFAKGQQQKKDHTEEATGFYHTTLLREGVTPVLRDTAGTEQLQGQLQAQHQLKAADNLHQSVYRCAMLWKQKALSKKLNKPCSFLSPLKKQVTFKMPDVSLETRGHLAEEEPWPSKCSHLPFHLADGDSVLSDLNAIRRARLPPRRPDFLLESLESNELLGPPFTRSEAPFQQTSVKKHSARTGNLMLTPQMEESTCKCISQMGNTSHSYPSLIHAALPSVPLWTNDVHRAVQRPELWSPSSFMSQMKAGAEMKELKSALLPLLVPCIFHSAEGEEREHSSREEVALQRKLEVELQHIQQQMQYFYFLLLRVHSRSCQQQAQILQKWLEKSMQPEAQDSVQGVQEELDQLQVRINTLSKAQVKERHHVQNLVARLHDIRIALDI
ncbi:Protein SFI1, partial [Haliaeetus albicilla]